MTENENKEVTVETNALGTIAPVSEPRTYNVAQKMLMLMGAFNVAGYNEHYHVDHATPKKGHKRPLTGRGNFGKNIMAKFAEKRLAAMPKKISSAGPFNFPTAESIIAGVMAAGLLETA